MIAEMIQQKVKEALDVEPNPRNHRFEVRHGVPVIITNCETLNTALQLLGFSHALTTPSSMGRHSIFRGEAYLGEYNAKEAWELLRDLRPDAFA